MKVILISAKQGGGKTTLQGHLIRAINETTGFHGVAINFADPLYEMHNFCRGVLRDAGIETSFQKDGNLLQLLGTEWGRETIDKDLWVKVLRGRILKNEAMINDNGLTRIYVIGDCRFENEFHVFPEALKIRLDCDKEIRKERVSMWRENDQHPSEIGLDQYAAQGLFHLYFNTAVQSPEYITEQVLASSFFTKRRGE